MIILGIDPALTTLGWGVIQTEGQKLKYLASGIIKTSSNEFMQIRLANIVNQIEKIILNYTPQLVSMEETFVNVNPTSSLKLGYVRGALMALIGKYSINFLELKPNLIKKAIVGKGHAEKAQVLHMIKLLISDTPIITSFDEADALAIAYAGSVYGKNT